MIFQIVKLIDTRPLKFSRSNSVKGLHGIFLIMKKKKREREKEEEEGKAVAKYIELQLRLYESKIK